MDASKYLEYIYNPIVEQEVLGAVLKDYTLYDNIPYSKDLFYNDKHQRIYEAMGKLKKEGIGIDIVTMSKNLPQGVTMTYISQLSNTVASLENFESHLNMLLEYKRKRDILKTIDGIDLSRSTEALGNELQKLLDRILTTNEESKGTKEYLYEYLDNLYSPKKDNCIKTGLYKIDKDIGGLRPGQLITIAGYTGMGKSILAAQIIYNMLRINKKVILFSLEMGREEIINKIVSNACSIEFNKIFTNRTSEEEKLNITNFISKFMVAKDLEIYEFMDDINKISSQIKKDKLKGKVDVVFIDLVNRITDGSSKEQNRATFLSSITRRLKLLAGKLEIPIVITAQINRSVEYRKNKAPTLADVKESGGIAEDSDYVFGLYRNKELEDEERLREVSKADYMLNDADVNPNCIEIHILKGRNIQCFKAGFLWMPKYQRIADTDWRF